MKKRVTKFSRRMICVNLTLIALAVVTDGHFPGKAAVFIITILGLLVACMCDLMDWMINDDTYL